MKKGGVPWQKLFWVEGRLCQGRIVCIRNNMAAVARDDFPKIICILPKSAFLSLEEISELNEFWNSLSLRR